MKMLNAQTLLLLVLLSSVFACSNEKDDDPKSSASVEVPSTLVTTYTGALSYTKSDGTFKANEEGKATLTKSGSTYTITFSDGVPSVSGLRFSSANGAYATTSSDGSVAGISVKDPTLDINVTKSDATWSFSGTK